ncbi:hypothetical protein A1E_04910 [Rickettsia canadensis str. McKiel]|uniref:Uncharacterized protein n=1 Tax=Rickettsia canadensis (strain McKiel) TaxID=293613 RepID=A8EZW5_RICCK|nr:hypothetical protein [Rickettsia canadensis]ABV73898.1 hypothetical protein A1E_04910 [Rickettsia canadensis str. McKiel]
MSDITATLKYKFNNLKEYLKNSYSRSQIEAILVELSSLQSEAASYGLNFDILNLKENAEAKIKNFELEQNIDKIQTQEEEFLKSQRAIKLAKAEREIVQRIAALNNLHNEFIKDITKDTKRIEESNKRLDKIINKLEKENIIDHEELNRAILTHEEIFKLNQEHKVLNQNHKKITEEHKQAYKELNELNSAITNLTQQLQEKGLAPEKVKELKGELEFYQEMLKIYKPYVEQIENSKKILDQAIIKREKEQKINKEKIKKLGSDIKECYKKEPAKYLEAYEKYVALKNQCKAIETNGVVKNIEHHNKVINKINADKTKSLANKIREQIQVKDTNIGSLSPSRTPNNPTNNKTRGI